MLISQPVSAQLTGDYRAASSGAWNAIAWERYTGSAWVSAASSPDTTAGRINIPSGITVRIEAPTTADQLIVQVGGALVIDVNSGLTLANGAGDDLDIYGDVTILDGSLMSPGSILIRPSGTLTISEATATSIGGVLTNNGTIEWVSGNIGFTANVNIINNATLNIRGNNTLQNGPSFPGGLINNGTVNKISSGTTSFTISNGFVNNGTVNLNAGTITSLYLVTNTGTFSFNSGTFVHQSTFDHNGGNLTGTGYFINSGVLNLNVDHEFSSTLLYTMESTCTTDGPGDLVLNQDFVIEGNFRGTGTLTIHGNTVWNNRIVGRNFTNETGRTLTLATSTAKVIAAPIINNGTIEWQDGDVLFYANTSLTNNGTLTISGNNTMSNGDSFGALVNTGAITKTSSGTTTFTLYTGVLNSGTINLNAGTITSMYPVTNTGTFSFNSGTFIHQSTFDHNGGNLTGTGYFINSGVLNLNVDHEFSSTLLYTMESTCTTDGPGDLVLNQDFVVEGNFRGAGTLTIHGNTVWNSRTIGRSFTNETGRTLTLATSTAKVIAAPIINNGTMEWQDGDVLFYANTSLTNHGTLTISGNNTISNGDSFGALVSTGTITKTSSGTTTFTLYNGILNSGTINLNGGDIIINHPITNSGNLHFGSGSLTHTSVFNHNAGSMDGTGHFTNSGVLNLNVDQEFPSTLIFSMDLNCTTDGPGDLVLNQDLVVEGNFKGEGTLTIHGNTLWNSRIMGRRFTNETGRTFTLATTSSKIIAASFTNNGTMDWQGGSVLFYANIALVNNGTFIISGNNEIANGTYVGTFTNEGTIRKTSTGTTTFTLGYFNNMPAGIIMGEGQIDMQPATSYTNSGTISPGVSTGILEFNTRPPLSENTTLQIEMQDDTGPGTGNDQLTRNGDLVLAGTLTVTQTGAVPAGTYTIISLSSGIISGTFNTVNLPAGYSLVINENTVQLTKEMIVGVIPDSGDSEDPIAVYPNPVKDVLQVKVVDMNGPMVISIFDAQGRQVISQPVTNQSMVQLPVQTVAPGIYYLRAKDGAKTVTLPFVKE